MTDRDPPSGPRAETTADHPPDSPHDALFRALLADPRDAGTVLLEQLPPEITRHLSETPPRLVDGSFVDPALRGTTSDRLYAVTLTDTRPAFLYVLLEHKSRPDPRTPLQILGYMLRIWERHVGRDTAKLACLPPILPLVLYHGRARWRVPTSVLDCLDMDDSLRPLVQDLRYTVRDLGRMPPESLSTVPHIRAVLMALRLGTGDDAPLERLVEIVAALPDDSLLERQVVHYIVRVIGRLTKADWRRVAALAKPDREDTMVSLAAQEWRAEGRVEGRAEGTVESVIMILEARFGPVDPHLRAHLATLTVEHLQPLVARAATIDSPDALFEGGGSS
ncbi:Rpn family recombination-promoting nuclease/putative transposase [Roseospira visakhapatnamensis]|uniref:Putative transposase YdaD n=1 Tax=Roseospira visakhapatnamensis TaxID=390880 RepID=A0A7W6RCI3_9PROT|nr:Rpn family recombination-promoting nuclease/putative transposase [Roseospira visakhapatnamensis]MBB4265890.1 putative transposase YdaD [Roseospira visakhapatnamensis]